MANAQFCPVCGDIISDGCPVLDADGNETNEINYSPCQCDLAARQPAPVVGDEIEAEFRRRFLAKLQASDDFREFSGGPFSGFFTGTTLAENIAIEIMREMSLAAQAVQVPEIPEGWALDTLMFYPDMSGGSCYVARLFRDDGHQRTSSGEGPEWQGALRDAISQAKGGQP